ncbi:MAG: hypothetical protein ACD_8C00029G0007 [uncultured bacterium]|nr:MAG: hypothetical protein ACD_8C00029G0007 [uncultured bacterium]
MKTLGSFIDKKKLAGQTGIDEKSVFYIFSLIIKEEYGLKGAQNIKPMFFRDKRIFIKISRSAWQSEIWLSKKELIEKINTQLGGNEVLDFATAD